MTSRERMLAAYMHQVPDSVPVSPEIWDATAIAVSGRPWYEVVGPFAKVPWWQTHLRAFEYFGCDAWIVAAAGWPQRGTRVSKSRFLGTDKENIETERTYRTDKGELHERIITCASSSAPTEYPVKRFPDDMEIYENYYFGDLAKGADFNPAGVNSIIAGVGEKGLVTTMVGPLFVSFLCSVRQGGIIQTIYDLCDHEDYCRRLQRKYIEYISEFTRVVLEKTRTQAVFINSDWSSPPMVSPEIYRQWDKPVLAAVAGICRKRGIPVHLHQHGRILPIIDDIIEAGISIVCPLFGPPQGDVVDLAEFKRHYGNRIALKGNIDPFEILLKGTQRDIEKAVKQCLQAAAPGGGYVLGTADSTVIGTPFENFFTFVEAGRKYGKYTTG
jgi:uroporphyrinogen decarboxylase